MKKIIVTVLLMAVVLGLVACSQVKGKVEYVTEDGREYLVLPTSKTKVLVKDDQKSYKDRIDYDLLKMADEKIADQIPENTKVGFHLEDREGCLYLAGEAIVDIDPPVPNGDITSGCGIDHEHLFFSEKISE